MTADDEDNYVVAQANEPLDRDRAIINERPRARRAYAERSIIEARPSQVDYVDVSPRQVVSVATAMIPFLENDDATRALMGSNMQRQAVPLLVPAGAYRRLPAWNTRRLTTPALRCLPSESGVVDICGSATKIVITRREGQRAAVQPDQVQALQPGHLHQPAPDSKRRASRW